MGQRIVSLVESGRVALFIATPGQLNIQPWLDGAADVIKKSGKNIQWEQIATGATVNEELSKIKAYYLGHQDVKGMFAVDGGSTQGVAETMAQYNLAAKGVHGGSFDLLPRTLELINAGAMDFTIDQQPYLQGFYTVMEMFITLVSGGLVGPANINTGLKFITKATVGPYLQTKTRYEGNATTTQIVPHSGPTADGQLRRCHLRAAPADGDAGLLPALEGGQHPCRDPAVDRLFRERRSRLPADRRQPANLSQFIAPSAIIACGEIMLMIGGEIDLSASMVFALAPFVMYFAMTTGIPPIIALLFGLAAGVAVCFINGAVTVWLGIPSFVTMLVENIVKRFGAITALNGITVTLRCDEILGILGDNGAGKSTLMKIMTGYQQPTSGTLYVNGVPVVLRSVNHARSLGIECVYQDLALANALSMFYNLFLNREIVHRGPLRLLDNRAMRRRASELLDEIGINIPSVDLSVECFSGGQRQVIAVARAINSNAKILLLDEPLATMGAREAGQIIDLILRLKARGDFSIAMIMHNYAQTLDIADRIILMQRGQITYANDSAATSVAELMDIVRREYRAVWTG
jgi:simple sugar transport system ATP-binding protein